MLVVALFVPRNAGAQITGGVLAGVNSARLSLPFETLTIPEVEITDGRRTGLIAGAFVTLPAGKPISFEVGAFFSEKGATLKINVPGVTTGTADYRLRYVDLPFLLRAGVARFSECRVFVLAGPAAGVKLSARAKASVMGESQSMDLSDELPAIDWGLVISGRVEAKHILGEVRYTHGLTDLSDGDEGVKNRVLSFLAGWRF